MLPPRACLSSNTMPGVRSNSCPKRSSRIWQQSQVSIFAAQTQTGELGSRISDDRAWSTITGFATLTWSISAC